MEIAPLIHSRTLHCDFNPNFAVRPSDINVNWAMKNILLSTSEVDILNGVRRLVVSDGKISIAGIACNLRFFAEKYLSDVDAKKYFHDERGREVKIFLGFAFKGGSQNEFPDVDYSMLWNFFKETLAPVWEGEIVETVIVGYKTCQTKDFSAKINPVEKINGIEFCETNEIDDEKLFKQCMAERRNFCSNADQIKIVTSGEFDIISTTQSIINRYKSETEKKNPPPQTSSSPTASMQTKFHPRRETPRKPSKSKMLLIEAAIVIIAVIILCVIK